MVDQIEDDLDLENWNPYPVHDEVNKAIKESQDKINESIKKATDQVTKYEIDELLIDEDFNADKVVDKINDIIDKNGADYYNGYKDIQNKATEYLYYYTTGYYTNAIGPGYYKKVDDSGYYQPKIKYKTMEEYQNRNQYRVITVPKKKQTIGSYIEKKAKDWFNWDI